MLLGKQIIDLRKSRGISQELLAENSSVSLRTIQRIEAGNVTPRLYTIKALANALGVPVEQLSSPEINPDENQVQQAITKLRLVNFSALAGLLIPFSNVFFTLLIWRKNKDLPLVNEIGRKIISFQLIWTLGTLFLVFLVPVVQYIFIQSYVIGRNPPPFFLVYIASLILNLLFTIRTAVKLQNRKLDIYSFIPILF